MHCAGSDKKFAFDYSYNSFVDRDDPVYATQDTVWADIGVGVLDNAYAGEALYWLLCVPACSPVTTFPTTLSPDMVKPSLAIRNAFLVFVVILAFYYTCLRPILG